MMRDQKPYLVRAFYDWIVDSGCTPYLQIQMNYPGVVAPEGFDDEGVLVLNISGQATNRLQLADQYIDFEARFRGKAMLVHIPMPAVLAIFAKENAQGMGFAPPDLAQAVIDADSASSSQAPVGSSAVSDKPKRDRSHLKVVK